MELHIIHLPHRIDRMQLLRKEIAQQGITDYRIWDGFIDMVATKGIAKAHQQIISYAISKRIKEIMIAEDDISFTAPGALNVFMRNSPGVYDLYLGGILWRSNADHEPLVDFCGLTLYMICEQFYDTFLTLTGNTGIDRELSGKGN